MYRHTDMTEKIILKQMAINSLKKNYLYFTYKNVGILYYITSGELVMH